MINRNLRSTNHKHIHRLNLGNKGSSICIAPADGETTGRRIRISRPADENARCNVLRASDQHGDFSPFTRQPTIVSTSSAISKLLKPTGASAPRRRALGARRQLPLENATHGLIAFSDRQCDKALAAYACCQLGIGLAEPSRLHRT